MNTTHPIKKEPCRIALVYLAIGKYDVFWDEFYHSCERYLFPDAEKHYFLFTDSPALLATVLPNVSVSFRKDEGWAVNALSKGIMALWHDESYLNKYLLERNPKVIGTLYCKPEEFETEC